MQSIRFLLNRYFIKPLQRCKTEIIPFTGIPASPCIAVFNGGRERACISFGDTCYAFHRLRGGIIKSAFSPTSRATSSPRVKIYTYRIVLYQNDNDTKNFYVKPYNIRSFTACFYFQKITPLLTCVQRPLNSAVSTSFLSSSHFHPHETISSAIFPANVLQMVYYTREKSRNYFVVLRFDRTKIRTYYTKKQILYVFFLYQISITENYFWKIEKFLTYYIIYI